MATLNQIKKDGTLYDIEDTTARNRITTLNGQFENKVSEKINELAPGIVTEEISKQTDSLVSDVETLKNSTQSINDNLSTHKADIGAAEKLGHVKVLSEIKDKSKIYEDSEVFNAKAILDLPVKEHASEDNIYGAADSITFGHVKTFNGYNYSGIEDDVVATAGALSALYNNKINNKVLGTDDMSNGKEGEIRQYLGETGEYKKGYFYEYKEGKWAELFSGGSSDNVSIKNLIDVSINESTLISGNILVYDAENEKWINKDNAGGGVSNLSELNDITLQNIQNNQILVYDTKSEKWINKDNTNEGQIIQIDEFTDDTPLGIYQYIGETNDTYVKGYFYEVIKYYAYVISGYPYYSKFSTPKINDFLYVEQNGEIIYCDGNNLSYPVSMKVVGISGNTITVDVIDPDSTNSGQVLNKDNTKDKIFIERINVQPGGGEGGTSDYNELDNRPKIAGVLLTGDKSLSDLGIKNFDGDYEKLTNKPDTFTPSKHTHIMSDITDLEIGDKVSVSSTGSSTNKIDYITINDVEYKINGGGEGSSSLVNLSDVEFDTTPSEKQVLTYDAEKEKWINADITTGTKVIPNPDKNATDDLTKININGITYAIRDNRDNLSVDVQVIGGKNTLVFGGSGGGSGLQGRMINRIIGQLEEEE